MEQNKLDSSQIIGFLFLIAAFISLLMFQPQVEEPVKNYETETNSESVDAEPLGFVNSSSSYNLNQIMQNELITIENDDVIYTFSTLGAQISKTTLKKYNDLEGKPQEIVNENQNFYFDTNSSNNFDTSQIFFNYEITESDSGKEIKFSNSLESGESIFFNYFIPNQGYLTKLYVYSSGYNRLLNRNSTIYLNWNLESFKNSKSQDYENRYTYLNYQDEDNKIRDLSAYSDDDDIDSAKWISYSQHFFTSILIFDDFKNDIEFKSKNLDSDRNQRKFLKKFNSKIPIDFNTRGEIDQKIEWYVGPKDYYIIKNYDYEIDDSIYFGWGIFGWINKSIFFPLYKFLGNHFSAGIAIILMVILTRLVMSPVQYKMYLSQAKMKILKPEITAATEKFKNDPMKRQQETMKIYSQAGASPVQGCLPALLQIPVFYALFCFFPVAFALRGESFLWADDLSTYDVVADLPFYIPLYGDHISLFPILAGVTMFFYTRMQGTQQMQPTQPGMPNMKIIMYIIPFSLLIFFNNFASGLSLYYTISNILTIIIMLFIKNIILDEKKILIEIEENKKKPVKEGRFQRRLRKLQEAAEKAQQQQNRKK